VRSSSGFWFRVYVSQNTIGGVILAGGEKGNENLRQSSRKKGQEIGLAGWSCDRHGGSKRLSRSTLRVNTNYPGGGSVVKNTTHSIRAIRGKS